MNARHRATRLAYVPHRPDIHFGYTAGEVLTFGLPRSAASDAARARAADLFEAVPFLGRDSRTLSAGQRQRVALARATAQLLARRFGDDSGRDPAYLIADEPIGPLDPRAALVTMTSLRTLAAEHDIGVIAVMHDLTLARRYADDAVLLTEHGEIAATGTARNVFTPANLEPVFRAHFTLASDATQTLAATSPVDANPVDANPVDANPVDANPSDESSTEM